MSLLAAGAATWRASLPRAGTSRQLAQQCESAHRPTLIRLLKQSRFNGGLSTCQGPGQIGKRRQESGIADMDDLVVSYVFGQSSCAVCNIVLFSSIWNEHSVGVRLQQAQRCARAQRKLTLTEVGGHTSPRRAFWALDFSVESGNALYDWLWR
jgi:hypothetical protein